MIKSFTDLDAWKNAHKLAIMVYEFTQYFPKPEQFGLTSQMRRSAVSVTSNLAEGFGRSSQKDKEHFYTMSSGSLYELKSQILLAYDLSFMNKKDFDIIFENLTVTHKLVNGLLRAHKNPNV